MVEKTTFAGRNNPSCMKCRYFDTITDMVKGRTTNICRKGLPSVFAMPGMAQPGQITWIQYTGWPEVAASDWCGEYQAGLDS
jgi:hypothetical protein